MQYLNFRCRKGCGQAAGMQLSLPQGLIYINVAESGDKRLVQQQRL